MSIDPKHVYQFGPFQLDTGQRLLMRDGEIISVTRKAFDTLCLLVENSGRVLQKEEMMKSIWPDSYVEEATLAQNVFTLRRVLDESPIDAQYIETVPRRGYRFIADVSEISPSYSQMTGSESGKLPAKALAVLPFKTLFPDSDNECFGLGMADALITRLSSIKAIVVRPTRAVIKYQNQHHDIGLSGQELKVQLVLDGVIQRLDDRVRVTVQLIGVEDGAPLWAAKFDEKFGDIFALQDSISERVVEALTLELTGGPKVQATKPEAKRTEASKYYLKGRYLWSKATEDAVRKSIACFERAIALAPNSPLPYVGLADTYTALGFYGYERPDEAMPQVKAMARRALQLNDRLAEARLPMAAALFFYDWDWAAAEEEFKQSLRADPDYALAHQSYGLYLTARRRFSEAAVRLKQALELDPVSPLIQATVGLFYYYSGQYDETMKYYREAIEEDPSFGLPRVTLADAYVQKGLYDAAIDEYQKGGHTCGEEFVLPNLGYAYAVSGERNKALSALDRLHELSEQKYISPFSMAIVHAGLDQRPETFDWLENACEERANQMVFLNVQPNFNRLHSERRFRELLKRVGLEQ